jgi:MoxR-like ATPase
MRPIVIITSNSEKNLPDAFLRRCVYHHIPPPDKDELRKIVALRVGGLDAEEAGLEDALAHFLTLRADTSGLEKKPATAELIAWLAALRHRGVDLRHPLSKENIRATLGVLVKLKDDLPTAVRLLDLA